MEPRIVPISAFKDNYVWTLRNERHAAVVDPGEARPVLEYLAREGLELSAILATHHHPDHVGGIAELLSAHKCPCLRPKKRAHSHPHASGFGRRHRSHPGNRRRILRSRHPRPHSGAHCILWLRVPFLW